jgi:hypothetical protein
LIPALEHFTALSLAMEDAAASTPVSEHAVTVLFLKPSISTLPPSERDVAILF